MLHDGDDNAEDLGWFADWYVRQCDGVWEHTLGVRLEPFVRASRVDATAKSEAPGWRLTIELAGTRVAASQPRTLLLDSMDGGWLSCSLTRDRFVGCGDAGKVEQMVGLFRRWMDPARQQPGPAETAAAAAQ